MLLTAFTHSNKFMMWRFLSIVSRSAFVPSISCVDAAGAPSYRSLNKKKANCTLRRQRKSAITLVTISPVNRSIDELRIVHFSSTKSSDKSIKKNILLHLSLILFAQMKLHPFVRERFVCVAKMKKYFINYRNLLIVIVTSIVDWWLLIIITKESKLKIGGETEMCARQ